MEKIFMNTENRKTNETHKFVFNLSLRLDLKNFKQTCCSSKLIYLLHMEKHKETVQKQ